MGSSFESGVDYQMFFKAGVDWKMFFVPSWIGNKWVNVYLVT